MKTGTMDLHIHTTYSSDGRHTPAEILDFAAARGVKTLAFADHMAIGAVFEGLALSPAAGLEFFSGLEFSTMHDAKEYHLLAYAFDPRDHTLQDFLAHYCGRVWEQTAVTLERFRAMGFDVEVEDIEAWGRSIPSGVTFLDALKRRNGNDDRLQPYLSGAKASAPYLSFYIDYLRTDLGVGLRRYLPDLLETLHLFRDRAVLVLAHPGRIDRSLLAGLKAEGLAGIEVYSTYHDEAIEAFLLDMSRDLDLAVSAGSDFHGQLIKPGIAVGDVRGAPSLSLLRMLRARSGAHGA